MADGSNQPHRPKIAEVQRVVCERKRITVADIRSAYRGRRMSWPRQVAMYLAREMTGCSYPKIGRMFGGRDHTTVMFAYRKLTRLQALNPDLEIALNRYREEIMEIVAARPVPVRLAAAEPAPKSRRPQRPRPIAHMTDLGAWEHMGTGVAA